MEFQQEQRQGLTQRVDPRLIMANSILQLSTLELTQCIENELLENPALDSIDEPFCTGNCPDPLTCPYCSGHGADRPEASQPSEDMLDYAESESDWYVAPQGGQESDEEYDIVGNLEAEVTLREHMQSLAHAALSVEDYPIGEYIINNLDDNGWLGECEESLARELGVSIEKVLEVLAVIQTFDPPGVAARNLKECLLLQLQYLREDLTKPSEVRRNALAEKMVGTQFELVVSRKYARLGRTNSVTPEEARQAVEYIRKRLNPYPANQYRPPWATSTVKNRAAVRPDVIIRRNELGYEIDILGADPFVLGLNPTYREAYEQIKSGKGEHSAHDKKHVTEYVTRAELFIQNILQRRKTLRMITRCIIECQTGFLETGSKQFLRPLTRTQIARLLELHESTVSRATSNKYVQLPNQDVISFDTFFDASLSIKDAIEGIIRDEDPASPLSDQKIVELLAERGITVARRTIVKYRDSQKILSSSRRRR